MDERLLTTCRYTGLTKTDANAAEFVQCPECKGWTHVKEGEDRVVTFDLTVDSKVARTTETKAAVDLPVQEGHRCSHCGAQTL